MVTVPAALVLMARVFGTIVFATGVWGKLRNWLAFTGIVANYQLMPAASAPLVAVLIVAVEIGVVASFATGIWLSIGALVAIALLIGFAMAIAFNLARGVRNIDCGCFQDAMRQPISAALVIRNIALAVIISPALGAQGAFDQPLMILDGILGGCVMASLNWTYGALIALREPAAAFRRRFA